MSILQPTNTYLKNKKPLVSGLCFKEYDTFSLNAYLRRFETNAIQLTNCSIQWKLINISTIQSIHKLEINETKQFDFKKLLMMPHLTDLQLKMIKKTKNKKKIQQLKYLEKLSILGVNGITLQHVFY
ncbi:hypothetical protein QTN25_007962 [Entamoeba marina]